MNDSRFTFVRRALTCALVLAALCGPSMASANGAVLVQGPHGTITVDDVLADSLRMPEEMRGTVLSRPRTVSQIASNLYVRRALAAIAQAQGVAADPQVSAALQVARDKVLSDAYLAAVDKANTPTDAAVESQAQSIYRAKPERFQAPEQVQISHILIAGNDGSSRAKAEKVLEELKAGANFAQLAKERSADSGSAAKGGDLGLFARGRMVPEFEEVAFALKQPGDLSGIVETKFGFHILQLEARRPAGIRPFADVREELVKDVRAKVQQDARVVEAEKAQKGLNVNTDAVEAFSATQKPAS